jgi:hypothetical protein
MAMMQMQSHTTAVMRAKQMLAVMQLLPLTHDTDEEAYSMSARLFWAFFVSNSSND